MKRYRAVIIGLTGIAAQRKATDASSQSHAAAYAAHPQTEVVAVCDLRTDLLERFRQTWGDHWPEARLYTDAWEMLATEQPDLVSIVTPDHRHAELTVAAAEGGAKAILCEKPLATSLADADRMIAACAQRGTLLSVEHTRRWSPIYRQARALIQSGDLGALQQMTVQFFGPRAMLIRNGAHLIDMLHFLADSPVETVWAALEAGYDHYDRYLGDGGHDPASEPAATGYLQFASGVRALYQSAKVPFSDLTFVLTCEHGQIEVTDQALATIRMTDSGQRERTVVPIEPIPAAGLLGAVDELIGALEGRAALSSSGESARQTVEVLLAMLQSHTRGNVPIRLPLVEA